MSKRVSTSDLKQSKSNKKLRTDESLMIDVTSSDSNLDGTFAVSTQVKMESILDELKEVSSKLNLVWKLESSERKMAAITNMFKELIDTNENRLISLFYELSSHMSKNSLKMDNKLVAHISSLLCLQIDSIPTNILITITDLFVDQIKNQQPLNDMMINFFVEVFKYLQKSSPQLSDGNKKSNTETSPEIEQINERIQSLLDAEWNQKTAINVLDVLKKLTLNQSQMLLLLAYLFDTKKIAWANSQIPSLIESVLSLNTIKSNRISVFDSILRFFSNFSTPTGEVTLNTQTTPRKEFMEVQRLSILHITNFIRTVDDSLKDLFKIIKSKLELRLPDLVEPFTFGLMLALVKTMPEQREHILELARQVVEKVYEAENRCQKLSWMNKCMPDEMRELTFRLVRPSKCRLFCLEPVLTGLIEFLFDLLDSHGVRINKATRPITLKEQLTKYSADIIRELFRCVPTSRETILNKITDRIVSSKVEKSIIAVDQLSFLVLSEPAGCFQEYFSKFRGRLDQMIFMIPVVALEFLNAIKPLLKYESIYKDNLIQKLKKSIYQNDVNIRKVGVCGLICLLNNAKLTNFLPSSQASQSMSLSQSQSQVVRAHLSQEKSAEENCLEIFQSLRRCLTQQSEIRSKLYQSCSSLIGQNPTLVGPTLNLLLTNFEKYLKRIDDGMDERVIMDFGRCCRIEVTGESNRLEFHEPIDVLMHALHLCNEKYVSMDLQSRYQDQLDEDIEKHSKTICSYFDRLRDNIVQDISKNLLDSYKAQVMLVMATKSRRDLLLTRKPSCTQEPGTQFRHTQQQQQQPQSAVDELNQLMPYYQAFLGSIEVLIEHYFRQGHFKTVKDLQKKFHELYTMISKLYLGSGEKSGSPKPLKKKPTAAGKSTQKSKGSGQTQTQAGLVTIDANEQTTIAPKTQQPKKKSSAVHQAKFCYTFRLSYSCTLNLLEIYYGKSSSKNESRIKLESPTKLEDTDMGQMKNDSIFKDYLMNVLSQQLEDLLTEATMAKTMPNSWSRVYNCEAYNDKQLFDYLNQIWIMFWQETSTSANCSRDSDKSCGEISLCDDCVVKRTTYVKMLSQVWKIVAIRFNMKLNELFSYSAFDADISRANISLDQSNMSTIAVGILDQCRTLVRKCLGTSNSESSGGASRIRAVKLATQVLELMYDLSTASASRLNKDDLNVLFAWSQSLSSTKSNNDPMLVKALLKYFIFVTWHKNSSAALMKYVCNYIALMIKFNVSKNESIAASAVATLDSYCCITPENFVSSVGVLSDELLSIIESFDWAVIKSSSSSNVIHMKLLLFVVESISELVKIELDTYMITPIVIKILVKFYSYMIRFCKEMIARKKFEEQEVRVLKGIFDAIARLLHYPFNEFIRVVQNSKQSQAGKKKTQENRAENDRKAKLSKYAKSMPNLVYLAEQYEQILSTLNARSDLELNLTSEYKTFVRDFKIDVANVGEALRAMPSTMAPVNQEASQETLSTQDFDIDDDQDVTIS